MNMPAITNEQDYRALIQLARKVTIEEKTFLCPDPRLVFHAELELHLNYQFASEDERWGLLFEEISPLSNFFDPSDSSNPQIQRFENELCVRHNTKNKYQCSFCSNEWTSARGRALFRLPFPSEGIPNVLFANLGSQQCQLCYHWGYPCWYRDEVTRIMYDLSKIIIENFYPDRFFILPRAVGNHQLSTQRQSRSQGRHQRSLCQACRTGTCFNCYPPSNR